MTTVPRGQNFSACYIDLCKQHRVRPLPVICVSLPHRLDFTTDRVKMDDWIPILNSLSLDRTLKSVSVRSKYQLRKPLEEINSEGKVRAAAANSNTIKKRPVVLTRYLLECLSHSVAQCIRNSNALTCLELEGVPLPTDCLAALCVGLASTVTLEYLSLERCYIGDNSCAMICRTIADVQSIRSLNLSHCDLSSSAGPALASALSRQKLVLYHDTWKNSLRYREPNLEVMPGLRRLTLNGNPSLGDTAIAQVIDAIQDSLWLKALDLQTCGLTDAIGNKIIELLYHNKTLQVIDVRSNCRLSENIVRDIFEKLDQNNAGCRLEYRLLAAKESKHKKFISDDRDKNNKNNENNIKVRPKTVARNKRVVKTRFNRTRVPVINKPVTRSLPSIVKKNSAMDKNMEIKQEQMKQRLHLDLESHIRSTKSQVDDADDEYHSVLMQLSEAKAKINKLEMELQEERTRRHVIQRLWSRKVAKEKATDLNEESGQDKLISKADEKPRVDLIIKKIKSEKIYREKKSPSKLSKSENDMKIYVPSIQDAIPVEKNIGDHRDHSSLLMSLPSSSASSASSSSSSSYEKSYCNKNLKTPSSACERARAIFAQIINSDIALNLDTNTS
ncbi:centrosomal protein of 78 kDa [Microplitis mediator]|uniref:centrosomal protein of 78 kDa n=1 Tax=Microplitis mediator TaxID=375433 RepID=UPI0025535D31|nr:centrosomal protein of 78 kDa [Microplitis mediator]